MIPECLIGKTEEDNLPEVMFEMERTLLCYDTTY